MAPPADNYIIARDRTEAGRLEIQHQYLLSCQGYYLHPNVHVPAGARIADLATGGAIFLHDIGSAWPTAECHGFDISDKMFPTREELPDNVELHVSDIKQPFEARWLGYFDVVHLRFLEAAMRKEDWGSTLQNVITLLKPGGWVQWVEDDRAHAVRHPARPVAPAGAARESLSATGQGRFTPPSFQDLGRFSLALMPNARADDMTYGYMNLDTLMKDPKIGDLEHVNSDVFVIDREDDGGQLRKGWAAMGIDAVQSMLKSRAESGDKLTDLTRDEMAEAILKDIAAGGHYVCRAGVFVGRKRA